MSLPTFSLIAVSLAWSAPLSAQSAVYVVDDTPGPGVDFSDLPAAVAAATDGNILVLRDGTYSSFTLSGKGLTIVAEATPPPRIAGGVLVEQLAPSQVFVMRGIETGVRFENALRLDANLGCVIVEDCTLKGEHGFNNQLPNSHADGFNAVYVTQSSCVVFRRCVFEGGDGAGLYDIQTDTMGRGGAGIAIVNSSAAMYDCQADGGNGGSDGSEFALSGSPGGPGGLLNVGLVHAASSSFTGGYGGSGGVAWMWSGCGNGADGGSGFYLVDGEFAHLDTTLRGELGGGGAAAYGCRNGSTGLPLLQQGGTVTLLPGTRASFEVPSPLRPSTANQALFESQPGEVAILAISLNSGSIYMPAALGMLLVGGTPTINFVGNIAANGSLQLPIVHPGVLRRREGALVFAQAIFVSSSAVVRLGPLSTAILLGP